MTLSACLVWSVFLMAWSAETIAASNKCKKFARPVISDALDEHQLIQEASGVAASTLYPDRLYHVTDSGSGAAFFITDVMGQFPQKVSLADYQPDYLDMEDLSLGSCDNGKSCLFIGNIGDNGESRRNVEILLVPEKSDYRETERLHARIRLRYPDRPQNAEAMAVHPNGDIYILTKATEPVSGGDRFSKWFGLKTSEKAVAARLYRLPGQMWHSGLDDTFTLEFVGVLDIPGIIGKKSASTSSQVVTSMDISPDGNRMLVMTYKYIIELFHPFSNPGYFQKGEWEKGKDFRFIKAKRLAYQEGISYTMDGYGLVYESEKYKELPQELVHIKCRRLPQSYPRKDSTQVLTGESD